MKISKDGREWLNDPGDERDIPEDELFGDYLSSGLTPEDIVTDAEKAERYRKWLGLLIMPAYFYRDPGHPKGEFPEEELFGDFKAIGTTPAELLACAVSDEDKAFAVRYWEWLERNLDRVAATDESEGG